MERRIGNSRAGAAGDLDRGHTSSSSPVGVVPMAAFKDAITSLLAADASGPKLVTTIKMIRFDGLLASLTNNELTKLLSKAVRRVRMIVGPRTPISRITTGVMITCLEEAIEPEALLEIFREPISVGEKQVFLPVSIGIARYPEHGTDTDCLINAAWLAAHSGRRYGESRCHFYHAGITERLKRRRLVEHALRQAMVELERGEDEPFELVYQPKVDLSTLEVSGVEALIRWNDPSIGAGPGEFIAIAEETGLIVPLGRWVVRQAFSHHRAWRACGSDIKLAINVSPAQLASAEAPRFAEFLAAEIAATGIEPALVEIEITEGIMADPDARAAIDELSAIGVHIAVDDFGKFYSNLAILSTIPASTLKIDKEFVDDILGDEKKRIIAQQVVCLARALGMRSIMEGVETTEQLDLLSSLGCDEVQGYVFSRPMPSDAIPLIQSKMPLLRLATRRQAQDFLPPLCEAV
jgi:EAL domain-containing protein (putative c-di-GMP-specific phosphodiesterase class I)